MKETINRTDRSVLILYFFMLMFVWAIIEIQVWPYFREINFFGSDLLSTIVKSGILKNLVWTLPALLLIRHYESRLNLSVKNMFINPVSWRHYLPVLAFFTVYLLAAGWFLNGKVAVSTDFKLQHVIISIFAGITEEFVFRGWLLNASLPKRLMPETIRPEFFAVESGFPERVTSQATETEYAESSTRESSGCPKKQIRTAVFLNALLFLAIHFPRWIHEGIFLTSFLDLSFLCVIVLSLIFSWAFIKSRSIFVPMVLHMYWDLLAFLLL